MYEVIDLLIKGGILIFLGKLMVAVEGVAQALRKPDQSQPYDYTQNDPDRPRSHLYDANKDPRMPE